MQRHERPCRHRRVLCRRSGRADRARSGYAERITLIADEHSLPYQRPPLSKDFLLDKVTQMAWFAR
jgi:hypothetical protein